MYSQDLNELTISGRVRSEPQLHQFDDGDIACEFVLTHSTDHYQTGNWELQYYNVSIWGQAAETFAETFQIDQKIVVTGRLNAVYDQTLTGYQPIVSIIANHIITTDPTPDPATNNAQLDLGELQHSRAGQ
jgi:single-stranded DNA-binding protein